MLVLVEPLVLVAPLEPFDPPVPADPVVPVAVVVPLDGVVVAAAGVMAAPVFAPELPPQAASRAQRRSIQSARRAITTEECSRMIVVK
ncbi:hypothetical protein [Variovorax sp. CF079]|uniref:hypothetical protein n=1 Tax=Variovorax sp. CF079 TaxID=1882774 RepID=UPI0014815C14|nr:hypothetical protein [Variovorax sp. CF079]